MKEKKLSLIISAYNEEKGLESFYQETLKVCRELSWQWEMVFVNDGSSDHTEDVLEKLYQTDPDHVKVITFSRNFGHEAAMTAGLDYAQGDALVFMDADLQHPPTCLPEIITKLEEGYEVISMIRIKNKDAGILKNLTSTAFYQVLNWISDVHFEPNASDFFAIDKNVASVLRKHYREKVRFLRGYVQNVGFKKTTIPYEAGVRVAGESHYSLRKLLSFSMNAIMCFSNMPLKLGAYAGIGSAGLGIFVLIYTLVTREGAPSGYATIVVLICFMFAVLFLVVGMIGEYLSVLFAELKDRPIYIVKDTEGIDEKIPV